MHEIMELKEMLTEELEKYGAKGDLSTGDLEVVDKLAHSIKNLCKIIEAMEMEEESSMYSRRNNYYEDGGSSYRRGGGKSSYYRDGGEDGGSSYRRGRGRNARRDSRGRYARDGGSMYYRDSGELAQQIEELMEDAPNEQVKQRMRQLMQDLQQM